MEDNNGLELSLDLSCGGLTGKSKCKSCSPSDSKTEEGDRGDKIVDDLKNFLHCGSQIQNSAGGSQRSDSEKPPEYFNDLSKAATDLDASTNLNGRGLWVINGGRSTDIEEEKLLEASNKRKMLFHELRNQKKHEREAHPSDLHEKAKASHISITTTERLSAENDDVVESEVEGSISRMVSDHDNCSKRYVGVGGWLF